MIVGGVAATAHGSVRLTLDLDVVYARNPLNLSKIVAALADLHPYLRGAPQGLPFRFDEKTLQNGLNFTLTTDWGDIDLLGLVADVGTYEEATVSAVSLRVFEVDVKCLGLQQLLDSKRAAGRPKDFEVIAELEEIEAAEED